MGSKGRILLILIILFCKLCSVTSVPVTDTILQGQQLGEWERLVSANKKFILHFYCPIRTSKNLYLVISSTFRHDDDREYFFLDYDFNVQRDNSKVVWVANRDSSIQDGLGRLVLNTNGILKIADSGGDLLFLNPVPVAENASATLLDNGNLVLRKVNSDGSAGAVLWQSFDYPTHTLLPGMKLGINFKTGHKWSLISWASYELPAKGSFTLGLDPSNTSQLIIWWQGNVFWTGGFRLNGSFEFAPGLSHEDEPRSYYEFVSNENETYFKFSGTENFLSKYVMDPHGYIIEGENILTSSKCPFYNILNDTGCVMNERSYPKCRSSNHSFEKRRGYWDVDGFKLPNLTQYDCEQECFNNCSCVAYALIADNQTGCQIWSEQKGFTIERYDADREIYILESMKAKRRKWAKWFIIAISGVVGILFCCSVLYLVRRKLKVEAKKEQKIFLSEPGDNRANSSNNRMKKLPNDGKRAQELQLFDFVSISSSTGNFATENKLGEGGFGSVYKGVLNGQEVAIKRLSRSSRQGVVEFENELAVVAKLQHNNLVRLIGCCAEKEEKILVYEYMPNKSLDFFLFDRSKTSVLDWKTRLNIVQGISQGLIYLHKYSRLRIVHRDLKASNILLDNVMNPKISDFGMARIFGGGESEVNTKRIVGTFGYMPPEYAMKGIFSIKSDVFSFEVLLLEIISGKKNNSCYHPECPLNLTGYAWELWREGKGLELVDPAMEDLYEKNEIMRCIHVGLLCVQDNPNDRPDMLDIVSMINNESARLSTPRVPAFFIGHNLQEGAIIPGRTQENCSLNKLSISEMDGR